MPESNLPKAFFTFGLMIASGYLAYVATGSAPAGTSVFLGLWAVGGLLELNR